MMKTLQNGDDGRSTGRKWKNTGFFDYNLSDFEILDTKKSRETSSFPSVRARISSFEGVGDRVIGLGNPVIDSLRRIEA
jgi:hypothetical protein